MRISTILHIIAFILFAAIVILIGFINAISPVENMWVLYGVVVVLCVGILLTGGQIRSIHITKQKNLAEEQLSIAEARFKAFFNDPAVGIGILGLDRRLIDANPTLCRILGRTREELIGVNSAEVTYPDDDPTSARLFAELLSGQRDSYEADRRYIRKNGDIFWAHVTMSMVCGSDNKPRYLVGMVLDVDEQKRNALALEESEARFRAAFDSSAIGIALMTIDAHFIKPNAAICKMSGYTDEELKQLTADETVFPEDAQVGLDLLAEMMAGKRDYYQVERRYVRKNGQVFWTRLTLSAVRGADGVPAYLVALVEDIDEQKRMATDLRKSEARFQAVFENIAVGITVLSLDGRVLATNPVTEQIVGYSESDLRSMNPLDLMFEEDRGVDADLYQELIAGRRNSYVSELRYRRKDGSLYWARVNYSLVRDLDGEPDYLIALVENIDEEKRASEKIAAQEAEHRRMLEQRIAERTEELSQVNQLLQQKAAQDAVNNERTRLARDLHDAVTQTLFSASLIAEVLPTIWETDLADGVRRLEELRQLTRGALAEMRMLLVELRPNALTEIPLPDLIRQLCESVIGRDRLPIQLNLEGQRKLPAAVQIGLYRIAQEALNNVVKHARATQAVLTLRMDGQVRLVIADNGFGFDLPSVPPDHFGLQIMRERADSIGAYFSIESGLNEGTQISVTWQERDEL